MRRQASARIVAVLGLAAALMSACSSSTKSSAPTTAATAGSSGTAGGGASGTPIVVGNVGSYSGAQSGSLAGGEKVIKAWADYVNANGGIDGHPVKLIVEDDQGNATTAITAVKQLIADHVVAIVGEQSDPDSSWASVAQQAGVPVVGGLSLDLPFMTNPDFFAAGTNAIALSYGVLADAKTFGPKFAILYCAEAAQCQQAVALNTALGAAQGVTVAYSASISATAPDYTAVCQALKASGAQSYEIADASPIVLRVATQCAQQGVTAKNVTENGTITMNWTQTPAVDGVLSAETDFPFVDTSVPNSQAFQTAISKYAPDLGSENGPNASYAWVAGLLFQKAAAAAGPGPITAQSIKTGLYTLKDETLGGVTPPLTFVPGQPAQVDCYFTLGISGGKFTEPKGLTTSCAPSALIGAILSKLAG
jgi:branched-chain amino acid transport system substrate-binding protein